MHPSTLLTLAALAISSTSATTTLAPFGLADPVPNLAPRATGTPSADQPHFHCDSTKLTKICGPNFLPTFESKHPNITAPCKSEISQAQTYVCNYWKSGNVSESCAAVSNAWARVKQDKCLPSSSSDDAHHHHNKCNKKKLDHICQGGFLTQFESKGNLTEACKGTVNGAWSSVCDEWKGNANVTAACGVVKTQFKNVVAQGCLPSGMLHYDGDGKGAYDAGSTS